MTYHIDWLKDKFTKIETIKYVFFWGIGLPQNAKSIEDPFA
jgi:hypothetical protein